MYYSRNLCPKQKQESGISRVIEVNYMSYGSSSVHMGTAAL